MIRYRITLQNDELNHWTIIGRFPTENDIKILAYYGIEIVGIKEIE